MAEHLVFARAPIGGSPAHLVFGEDLVVVLPPVTAEIAATLSGAVSVTALAAVAVRAQVTALLSGTVTVSAAALYDNRVTPWLDRRIAAPHQVAVPTRKEQESGWRTSLPQRHVSAMPWRLAARSGTLLSPALQAAVPVAVLRDSRWGLALGARRDFCASLQSGLAHSVALAAKAELARQQVRGLVSIFQTGVFHSHDHQDRWQTAAFREIQKVARFKASRYLSSATKAIPWQVAGAARNGRSSLPVVVPPIIYPRDGHLVFECPPLPAYLAHLVFGARACYLPPRAHVVVPFLRTYVTINSITLRRVSDGLPITAYGFGMSLDWTSWTWSWSASIPAHQLPLVRPGISGDPLEIEVLVNGIPYRLCAEGLDRQRTFAKGRVGIKGRGTAAILDEPYAPVLNFGNAEARTAQQLMSDALTINGVGIGWDVDWGLADWLVPGNAWTHQGAYIGAILDIAGAAGGYVQPHATEQTLRILPQYPEAPWNWAGVTPDFELPGIATVEGIDWRRKAAYNRIFVSGIGAGVLGQVTRSGTAGDSVAPMVTHSLITHAIAARQRGLAELSDTGKQAHVSLKLPVLEETGLILPGKFVRYLSGSETHLGLTRSISLDWSRPVLRQTISVETYEATP
ncbi:hypothetical protein [Polaromonas naphthalenivorans]|uniref:Uncharacterized protein n=1 Tax=Polaromonas naphthalenivorans (strain CJ2) TaxID=365044 RepID=A1VPH2_POLNA|nr:hypothetical protein [Polaromonas naphthalenivorans]ABM37550.1 hypothetical protein Pnap_2242 [Polaromonas naphthalenivorans CJ2]